MEVQTALLMTVQMSTSGQRRTKALEDDLEASGGHLETTRRALAMHFEATWSTWSPLGAHLEPKLAQDAPERRPRASKNLSPQILKSIGGVFLPGPVTRNWRVLPPGIGSGFPCRSCRRVSGPTIRPPGKNSSSSSTRSMLTSFLSPRGCKVLSVL